jgi:hypothetical protein
VHGKCSPGTPNRAWIKEVLGGLLLAAHGAMGKHDRTRKDVKRLQLRREVIRVLGKDSLARVGGGRFAGSGDETNDPGCIPTWDTGDCA